jgi:hyperosmotically inducible protein
MNPFKKRNAIKVYRYTQGVLHLLLAGALAGGTAGCLAAVGAGAAAGGTGGYAAAKSGKTAGEIIDDSLIATRVKTALLKSPLVRGLNINVDVELGIVYLVGVATDQREIEEAIRLSRAVEGVRQVRSNLVLR